MKILEGIFYIVLGAILGLGSLMLFFLINPHSPMLNIVFSYVEVFLIAIYLTNNDVDLKERR